MQADYPTIAGMAMFCSSPVRAAECCVRVQRVTVN